MTVDIHEDDARWLAGWLEGEGCFFVATDKRRPNMAAPAISACSTDRDVLKTVVRLAGADGGPKGGIYDVPRDAATPNHKPKWQIRIVGWRARAVMEAVRPYMHERRGKKIDEVLGRG